ncbi:hypothetical protein N7447_008501 [Penicillium robsamsonii]|uniref:uncharacterized protein n=1 Tax=Penicillium robsamsonii TaxID=1792511 RepID=UPI00254710C6|nr:uncharacterized protein N7447_008501 [Penicillium robsamsonii]KAJ5816268.1 hypothetical protein N7447_008501 [Penicillium robsamsonii]
MINRSHANIHKHEHEHQHEQEHEHEQDDAPEMKDPLQPGSSDIDERMSTQLALTHPAHTSYFFPDLLTTTLARDYKEAIDKTNILNEDRLRPAKPQSSRAYQEPSEEEIDISWRPDPSGHPRRTF